jgi:hypothetical protein
MTSTPAEQIASVLALSEEDYWVGFPLAKDIIREQNWVIKQLVCDVDEYVRWRKTNKHIKGGGNYLSRFRKALALAAPFLDTKPQKQEK